MARFRIRQLLGLASDRPARQEAEPERFSAAALAAYREGLAGSGGDAAASRLVEVKSLPRSGLHYLVRTLGAALGNGFSFCEWYNEPGCCRRLPCLYTGFVLSARRHWRLIKSHDLDLRDPVYPPVPGIERWILVRDPLYVLTSWWVLYNVKRHAGMLKARDIDVDKLFYRHEAAVRDVVFAHLAELYQHPPEEKFDAWLEKRTTFLGGFVDKWGAAVAADASGRQRIVRYETLPRFVDRMLPSEGGTGSDDFRARTDPFETPLPALTEFVRERAARFQAARDEVIARDSHGVFGGGQGNG